MAWDTWGMRTAWVRMGRGRVGRFSAAAGFLIAAATVAANDEPPAFARNLRLTSIVAVGLESRVGLFDVESGQAFFLRSGETLRGIELVGADFERERATLRHAGEVAVLPLHGMPERGVAPPAEEPPSPRAAFAERMRARRAQFAEIRRRVAELRERVDAVGSNRARAASLVDQFVQELRGEGHFAEATERPDGTWRLVLRGDAFSTTAVVGTAQREMTGEEIAAERARIREERSQANARRGELMSQARELRAQLEAVEDEPRRRRLIETWVETLRREGYVVTSDPDGGPGGRHRVYVVDAGVSFMTHL